MFSDWSKNSNFWVSLLGFLPVVRQVDGDGGYSTGEGDQLGGGILAYPSCDEDEVLGHVGLDGGRGDASTVGRSGVAVGAGAGGSGEVGPEVTGSGHWRVG